MPTTLATKPVSLPARDLWRSVGRGLRGRCPHCGEGKLFGGFLKVVHHCDACGEEMHYHRADDLPAYLSIVIVGHIVVGILMHMAMSDPTISPLAYLLTLVPLTIALSLALLQPIKGGVVGLQWANYMHGFHPVLRD